MTNNLIRQTIGLAVYSEAPIEDLASFIEQALLDADLQSLNSDGPKMRVIFVNAQSQDTEVVSERSAENIIPLHAHAVPVWSREEASQQSQNESVFSDFLKSVLSGTAPQTKTIPIKINRRTGEMQVITEQELAEGLKAEANAQAEAIAQTGCDDSEEIVKVTPTEGQWTQHTDGSWSRPIPAHVPPAPDFDHAEIARLSLSGEEFVVGIYSDTHEDSAYIQTCEMAEPIYLDMYDIDLLMAALHKCRRQGD